MIEKFSIGKSPTSQGVSDTKVKPTAAFIKWLASLVADRLIAQDTARQSSRTEKETNPPSNHT